MNEILENNLAAIRLRIPELYHAYSKEWQETDNVKVDLSAENEKIVCVCQRDRWWYLNSRYSALEAAKLWAAQCSGLHYKSIVFLCGISNGAYLNELLKHLGKENKVVVYEPDPELFGQVIREIDLSKMVADERIMFFVEQMNMGSFRPYFQLICDLELIELTKVLISPGYDRLYAQPIQQFIETCQMESKLIWAGETTLMDIGEEICDNILGNLWELCKAASVNALKAELEKEVDLSKLPVIIVSAGPSLDKNVEDLKAAKGKALIFAVDSAIKKLLSHGIIPDLLITVDSHKPMTLFENPLISEIPLVICGQSRHDVFSVHKGKKFVFSGDMFSMRFFAALGKDVEALQTGGSVANNAFSLAEFLGFCRIILVGQDLAFTDNRIHASNVYEEKGIDENSEDDYTYVDDYEGKPLLTFTNFKMYKEWFEGRIQDHSFLQVYNATEGGANIIGAKNVRLQEIIQETCTQRFDAALLMRVPDLFDDGELLEVYETISRMKENCTKLIKRFQEGQEIYWQMKNLIGKGIVSGRKFEMLQNKVQDISQLDKREALMELLSMYAKKEESRILQMIYQENEGLDGAISAIMHSREILGVYCDKMQHIQKSVHNLIACEMARDVYEVNEYSFSS